MSDEQEERPTSYQDKEKFSSGGKTYFIILRGKWGQRIDKFIVWLTGYSIITKQYTLAMGEAYKPTLLLKTIGAKTHQLRTATLPFYQVGDDLVVRGSAGGGPKDPQWVHNIRANQQVWVRINRKDKPMQAHVAQGEEREKLYKTLCEMSYTTARYQEMCAPRELPLVVLRSWV
ncbi:nitroreductase family deazaflavin-dependent oxidoreductase [Halieaceae bacterium]|nr:nitroreductase family deazaflavin-dependent oxidoreductase [Halieaceae bacterium]